jgi:hypothetical protein
MRVQDDLVIVEQLPQFAFAEPEKIDPDARVG